MGFYDTLSSEYPGFEHGAERMECQMVTEALTAWKIDVDGGLWKHQQAEAGSRSLMPGFLVTTYSYTWVKASHFTGALDAETTAYLIKNGVVQAAMRKEAE